MKKYYMVIIILKYQLNDLACLNSHKTSGEEFAPKLQSKPIIQLKQFIWIQNNYLLFKLIEERAWYFMDSQKI